MNHIISRFTLAYKTKEVKTQMLNSYQEDKYFGYVWREEILPDGTVRIDLYGY